MTHSSLIEMKEQKKQILEILFAITASRNDKNIASPSEDSPPHKPRNQYY